MSTSKSHQSCYPATPSIMHLDGVDIEEIIARYATPTPVSLPRAGPHRSLKSPPTTAGSSTFLIRGSSPKYSSSLSDASNFAHSGSLNRAQLFGRSPIPEFVPRRLRRPSTAAGCRESLGRLASIPSSTAPDCFWTQRSASLSRIPVPSDKVPTYIDCVPTRLSRTVPRKSFFFKDDDWSSKKANKPTRNAPTILKRQTLNGFRPSNLPALSTPLQDECIEAGDAKAVKDTTKPRNVLSPLLARQDQKLKSCLRKASDSDSSKSSTVKSVTFEDEVSVDLGSRKPASSADMFRERMDQVTARPSALESAKGGPQSARIPEDQPRGLDTGSQRNLGRRTSISRKSSSNDSASFVRKTSVRLNYGGSTSLAEKYRTTMDRVKARLSSLESGKEGPKSRTIQKKYRLPLCETDSNLSGGSSSLEASPSSKLAPSPAYEKPWATKSETCPGMEIEPELSSGDADISGEGLTSDSSSSDDSSLMSNDPEAATTTPTTTFKPEIVLLKIMTPVTIFSQAPQAPLEEMPTTALEAPETATTIVAPTTTHYRAPIPASESTDIPQAQSNSLRPFVGTTCQLYLTFSPGSGAIYGCVAFVVMYLALMHLVEILNAIEFGHGLTAGFVVGLVFAFMVSLLGNNTLTTTTKEAMQAWRAALGTIYQAMLDWISRYEVH